MEMRSLPQPILRLDVFRQNVPDSVGFDQSSDMHYQPFIHGNGKYRTKGSQKNDLQKKGSYSLQTHALSAS